MPNHINSNPILVDIQTNWWIDVFAPPFITGVLVWAITYGLTKYLDKEKEKKKIKNEIRRLFFKIQNTANSYIIIDNFLTELLDCNNPKRLEAFSLSNLSLEILQPEDAFLVENLYTIKEIEILNSFYVQCYRYRVKHNQFLFYFKKMTELSAEYNSYTFKAVKTCIETAGLEHFKSNNLIEDYKSALKNLQDCTIIQGNILIEMLETLQIIAENKCQLSLKYDSEIKKFKERIYNAHTNQ